MKTRILYTKPSITDLGVFFATEATHNGWGEKCYDLIIRFEEAFKAHLGHKFASVNGDHFAKQFKACE